MSLVVIRKRALQIETVFHEGGPMPARPLRLAAATAVVTNPFAGSYDPNLLPFMAELRNLGGELAAELRSSPRLRSGKPWSFGSNGDESGT